MYQLGGERCFGSPVAFQHSRLYSELCFRRVRSSWERKQWRKPAEQILVRKLRFSFRRARSCWRSIGYFPSMPCCLWQVCFCPYLALRWLTFHLRFQLPLSRITGTLFFPWILLENNPFCSPYFRICILHTSGTRRDFRIIMPPSLLSSVIAWASSSKLSQIVNPNFPFFLRVPSRMSYQSALPSSFSYWLRNRTEVVSLQGGWVNTWAVDWLWCPSRFFLTIFLASDMRYSYSSFILLVGGTYFFHLCPVHSLIFSKRFHPPMDLAFLFQRSCCRSLLCPVWCARSLGCCTPTPNHSLLHNN